MPPLPFSALKTQNSITTLRLHSNSHQSKVCKICNRNTIFIILHTVNIVNISYFEFRDKVCIKIHYARLNPIGSESTSALKTQLLLFLACFDFQSITLLLS